MAKLVISFEYCCENNMDVEEVLNDINTMTDEEITWKYGEDVEFDIEENQRIGSDPYEGWMDCLLDTCVHQAKPKAKCEIDYDSKGKGQWF